MKTDLCASVSPYTVFQFHACEGPATPGGKLYWSRVDGVFVAEVPELPGCMAHGDTQEAALGSVSQAMELWIDTARESGDPIPEPKGERLMLA